jgi:type III restriction enzyme
MRFKFDANQEFQVRAVEAVTDLFDGQSDGGGTVGVLEFGNPQTALFPVPDKKGQLRFTQTLPIACPNRLTLTEDRLLANLKAVQTRNNVPPETALACIEEPIETASGHKTARFPNFSVEMETGTGKTYVYLRTALELFRRYGFRKYVVVVPSVAIREGVLKTLQVTSTHLNELFNNTPYRYYVYESDNLSQVRQFALSNSVELMVMTIDSFNKASNVIHQSTDRLQGETPIHLVQAARPILILDEPQNMESELRVKALAALDPLFALRYSATHRNPYNVVYRLSPYEAYRQGLVKRIEVASVVQENDVNQAFLKLEGITAVKRTFTARLAVHKLMANGTVKEQTVTVKPGDSLEEMTGRTEYAGFDVDEINAGEGMVRFSNDVEIEQGESRGSAKDALFEAQIRYTVEEHFRKQDRLNKMGVPVKVLSLFFIDKVDNYTREDGLIRQLFDKAFQELKGKYSEWKDLAPEAVRAAYFAEKRRKGGVVEVQNSVSGKSREDEEAYDLIMKDKEVLLSFPDPKDDETARRKKQVCFIFSHSALREGWDNPNVFQICTLNQTVSEIKKRQEVGRGMRLAVNQGGDRVRDERVNILTVIANESYEKYVDGLQSEIQQDYGVDGTPPRPPDARRRGTAKLRKHYTLKPEFKELWERIKHKTRYAVKIDTEKLLADVVKELDGADIRPPRITITRARVNAVEDSYEALRMSAGKTVTSLAGRYPLPNLVDVMAHLLEHATPSVRLTRRTLLDVFQGMKNKQAVLDNPQEFASVAVGIIKKVLADHLVNGIHYEKINEWYEMTQLETEIESWKDYLIPSDHSVYDHVIVDSTAADPRESVEGKFVQELERMDNVKIYMKLPRWFTVPTPLGDYNPDWAVVMEDRDVHGEPIKGQMVYLVSETKGANWRDGLRPDERKKIECGAAHFGSKQFQKTGALTGVDYKVVTRAGELA